MDGNGVVCITEDKRPESIGSRDGLGEGRTVLQRKEKDMNIHSESNMVRWNGDIGVLTVSSDVRLPKKLEMPNHLGKETTFSFLYDEDTDVEKGDPLTYIADNGETVFVFFQ